MAEESDSPAWQPELGVNGDLSASAQLLNLRNLLSSDRQSAESQRGLETFDREMLLRNNMNERQRRDVDVHAQDHATPTISDSLPTNTSPSSLVRSRRRAFRPSERLQRHRERHSQAMRTDLTDAFTNVPRITPPPPFTPSGVDDYGSESRPGSEQKFRSKRRKLDDGTFDDETRIISYGDEGRVTPGPLKMEIIRCDGGDYSETTTGSAQLVLQDDKSVYSTKENKCNMLLKHIGGMPFSLTKIVIKAPGHGFDSPLQEGMVFVGLSDEKLLENTSFYDKYSPRNYRFHHPVRRHDYYRPSQEYLNSSRSPLRSIDRPQYMGMTPPNTFSRRNPNEIDLETSLVPGFDVTFVNPSEHEGSPSFTPTSPNAWRDLDAEYSLRSYTDRYRADAGNTDDRDNASVTSSESEDEYVPPSQDQSNNTPDVNDNVAPQRRHHMNYNRLQYFRERDDPDFLTLHPSRRAWREARFTGNDPSIQLMANNSMRRMMADMLGSRRIDTSLPASDTRDGTSSKTTLRASALTPLSSSETLPPHARFSMAESQTSIAINFDPPVAGRYILIKLWASCPASNIDIQCIIPHGYGGPRFFPSIEFR